jgi:hypothetical protein
MAATNEQLENDLGEVGRQSAVIKVERTPSNKDNSKHLGTFEQSGWYYDQQLIQPLTSVRLLSNAAAMWKDDHWEFQYSDAYDELLASSILAEDFSIDANNSWVDNSTDDMIGGVLNSFKTITPYIGTFHNVLKTMSKKQKSKAKAIEGQSDLKATSFITKVVDYFGDETQNGSEALKAMRKISNGSFMSQGCSFSYYGGSNINFGNLGLKFTIFPNFATDGSWKSVIDQVALLLPYCVGILQDVPWDDVKKVAKVGTDLLESVDSMLGTSIGDFLESAVETASQSTTGQSAGDLINQYIKWQAAPGGYSIDKPQNIDVQFPGTLCLEVGSHYKIEGLVASNINLQFSKQLVRNPVFFSSDGKGLNKAMNNDRVEDSISPLYCEVSLMLRPITTYSSVSLMKFVKGNIDKRKDTAKNILKVLDEQIKAQTQS